MIKTSPNSSWNDKLYRDNYDVAMSKPEEPEIHIDTEEETLAWMKEMNDYDDMVRGKSKCRNCKSPTTCVSCEGDM